MTNSSHGQAHDDHHGHIENHLSDMDLRLRALESLLVEKGYVDHFLGQRIMGRSGRIRAFRFDRRLGELS
jgi:hypothetical protein